MSFPVFASGDVLNASDMNAVGLWKIVTTGTTSSSNLIVDNVFTSTFTNYRLVFSGITASNVTGLSLLWRSGGSTINLANYYGLRIGWSYLSTTVSSANDSGGVAHQISAITSGNTTSPCSLVVDVFEPQKNNRNLSLTAQGTDARPAGTGALSYSGFYNATTAIDGFVLNCGVHSFSNVNVTIYGYNA